MVMRKNKAVKSPSLLQLWQAGWLCLLMAMGAFSHAAANVDVSFVDLEGNKVSLSDYQGKWVVVNFWATWCPPCREEMPELGFFHQAHKDKDAVVLGVNYEDVPLEKVHAYLDQENIQFPIVRLPEPIDNKTTPFGPLRGLPTTYMISPEGKVLASRTGKVDQQMLEAFIKKYDQRQ